MYIQCILHFRLRLLKGRIKFPALSGLKTVARKLIRFFPFISFFSCLNIAVPCSCSNHHNVCQLFVVDNVRIITSNNQPANNNTPLLLNNIWGGRGAQIVWKNIHFLVWDLGGQQSLRAAWSTYYTNTEVRV